MCPDRNYNRSRFKPVFNLCNFPNSDTFYGCYGDCSQRLLPHFIQSFPGTNTHSVCMDHCASNQMPLVALQFGYECYCGQQLPHESQKRPFEDCREKTCPGNQSQYCGGGMRNLVLSSGAKFDLPIQGDALC